MTRMTGPDCAVMCSLINTYIHTHYFRLRAVVVGRGVVAGCARISSQEYVREK